LLAFENLFLGMNKLSLLGCTFPLFPLSDASVVGISNSYTVFVVLMGDSSARQTF
jgi:hypothetical protein